MNYRKRFDVKSRRILILIMVMILFASMLPVGNSIVKADERVIRIGYDMNSNFIKESDGEYYGYGVEYLDKIAQLHEGFEVRGIGFMWGIDCNKVKPDAVSRAIVRESFNNGLIVERAGRNNDVVKLMPPLLADEATLRKGLEILVNAVEKVIKEM